ncbi:hypothetical protein [Microbacterium sp.]|uniref:hypothetical protein n=1 Tax=Microbacterium sp. TaxID=51671 RepID=UPI0039E4686F
MTEAAPRLRFRFIGSWHPVLLGATDSPRLIETFLRDTTARRDDLAVLRAQLRAELRTAAETARSGGAEAMFLATEVQPGLPTPISLTLYAPAELRMSPAVGVDGTEVMRVFRDALAQRGAEGLDTAREIAHAETTVLRLHRVEPQELEGGASVRRLSAEYWMAVPGTKNVVLVNLATPLGDIPHVMLDFFDAIVRAACFDADDVSTDTSPAASPTR